MRQRIPIIPHRVLHSPKYAPYQHQHTHRIQSIQIPFPRHIWIIVTLCCGELADPHLENDRRDDKKPERDDLDRKSSDNNIIPNTTLFLVTTIPAAPP
jgi:hypothetical protein